jgi:hypothetical protein
LELICTLVLHIWSAFSFIVSLTGGLLVFLFHSTKALEQSGAFFCGAF